MIKKVNVVVGSFLTQFIIVGMLFTYGVNGFIFGIGFILFSKSSEVWHLFLIFIFFIGTGLSTHDISTLSTIAKWFESKRGLMTSIAKIGTAMGQMVMPPLIAFLIISFGWRTATFYLGVAASIGLVFAATLMSAPNASSGKLAGEETTVELLNKKVFNLLAFCQFCIFFAMFTTMTHIAAHGLNVGLSLKDSALLLSTIGFSSIFGRLSIGVLADILGGKKTYILCLFPMTIALITIPFTENILFIYILLCLYGFSHGGHFTIAPFIIAENFGLKNLGTIFGKITFFGAIGSVTGPIVAGAIFDFTQSYYYAFLLVGALALISIFSLTYLPNNQRKSS
jgi:MFS family permease